MKDKDGHYLLGIGII